MIGSPPLIRYPSMSRFEEVKQAIESGTLTQDMLHYFVDTFFEASELTNQEIEVLQGLLLAKES